MDSDTPNADAVGCYVRLCRELGVECCLEVLAALTTPSRACSLTDRATPLRDADVKAVAGMLRQHDAFDILNIEGNEVEQDGILSIANMLKRNTSLHTLRMAANLFRDGGVITLSHALLGNSALTSLDVSHNRIGGVACKALARVLQQQRGGAPGLEELVLHGNVIDAAAISHVTHALAGNTTLRHLHLGFNDLAGRGAAAVAGLFEAGSALRTVDLSNNRITDAEAASLFGAMARGGSGCALERLNVRSNLLGEKSFAALAGLLRGRTALREVFAGYNKPGPVAVATLLEAAARCTTLATLDVHGCTIPGAACLGRLLCGVGWPRAVRTDAGGSPLRSPVASAAFSCLLLDGVSCTSDADLLEQTRVWAGIRSTRLGVEERFQHVKKVFVGKETDRAACADDDDNDGTGGGGGRLSPAFFVGDLEKLRETTAATFSQAAADAQHGSWRQESVASHVEIAGPVGPEGSPPTARVRAAGGSVQAEAAAWPRSVRLSGDRPPPQASLAEVLERELAAERAEHRRKVSDLRAKLHALEAEEDEAEGVRVVGDVMRFLGAAAGGSVPRRGGLYKPWPTPMPPAEPAPQTSQSHQLHCGNRTSNPEQYNTAGKPGEEGRGLLENQASAGPPQPDSRQLSPPRPPPAAAARGFEPRRDGREHRCLSPPAPAGAGKPAAATVALAWGSLPAGSGAARRPPASGFEPSAFRQPSAFASLTPAAKPSSPPSRAEANSSNTTQPVAPPPHHHYGEWYTSSDLRFVTSTAAANDGTPARASASHPPPPPSRISTRSQSAAELGPPLLGRRSSGGASDPGGVAPVINLRSAGAASERMRPAEALREPVKRGMSPRPVPANRSLLGSGGGVEAAPGSETASAHDGVEGESPRTTPRTFPSLPPPAPPHPSPSRLRDAPLRAPVLSRASSPQLHPHPSDIPLLSSSSKAPHAGTRPKSPQGSSLVRRPSRSPRPVSSNAPTPVVPLLQDSRGPGGSRPRSGRPSRDTSRSCSALG